ncbi:hypothetical protein [Streptacidiphilus jiangxiensis]|uniref:WD domain-containing protein, G-beta repeat-containing protein n=1 Tax=Streptacidiphilus jiangxiensis TaxID=235985 RepID=A0A1H7HZ04_STRJI|nr:hypothetical protein [Streptacidiphilus jiangxiensis]SEK55583.1 hypothetical protein SAMN05414137_102428 [Streptacidiphilus jiangxiensis]
MSLLERWWAEVPDAAQPALAWLDVWGTPNFEVPSPAGAEGEVVALLRAGAMCGTGNAVGQVTWHDAGTGRTERVRSHFGPVSSLAVAQLPGLAPLVFSGGADGTVRLWSPGEDPLPEPLEERACPVLAISVAVAAGPDSEGNPITLAISWADGLVRVVRLDAEDAPPGTYASAHLSSICF